MLDPFSVRGAQAEGWRRRRAMKSGQGSPPRRRAPKRRAGLRRCPRSISEISRDVLSSASHPSRWGALEIAPPRSNIYSMRKRSQPKIKISHSALSEVDLFTGLVRPAENLSAQSGRRRSGSAGWRGRDGRDVAGRRRPRALLEPVLATWNSGSPRCPERDPVRSRPRADRYHASRTTASS
jgi:hypothetical protein